jgi:hypothetical protein
MLDATDLALTLARKMVLDLERQERTNQKLQELAAQAADIVSSAGPVGVDELVRLLQADFDVWVPRPIVVSRPDEHEEWLEDRRASITFSYWNRYRTLLDQNSRVWKPSAVESLDDVTDQILGLLEDPQRAGDWKTYGMVYGQVQSGKTASYTGVVCKAMDAGYRVILVLTSQHESLRHQTQERLDREFLGFNTKFTSRADFENSKDIGVGALGLPKPDAKCQALTTRDKDFTAAQLNGTAIDINDVPILVVAKKNARVLNNLIAWLDQFSRQPDGTSGRITDLPLLLVDDEADYASVDTKLAKKAKAYSDPDHDPTAINKAIRGVLNLFEKRAYLAYTATPFANIFIPYRTDHPEYGDDLFPRSFLVALEPPSNYCGPEVVFGLEDPSAEEIREPLPVIRDVSDQDGWLPDVHRRGHQLTGEIPDSLVEAVDAFVLSTAVRRARELDHGVGGGHCTMLIHVTRYTAVQRDVVRQVRNHLEDMAGSWGDRGRSGRQLRERLAELWQQDFEPTYQNLADRSDVVAGVGPRVEWARVLQALPEVLRAAAGGVKEINGTATDVLEYQSPTPVTVVAVGGDKLSRGLTLEGLSVSYYLRASKNYDTLLQMGRWFGYRPDYLDVTRLYTTEELVSYYVHITRASRELMDLVGRVAKEGKTPKIVGMRVRDGKSNGVGNLEITAAAKRRSSTLISVGYSALRPETLVMRKDRDAVKHNYAKLEKLVSAILPAEEVPEERRNGSGLGIFRRGISPTTVLEFLRDFAVSDRVLAAAPGPISDYVRKQNAKDELVTWTVGVTGGSSPRRLDVPGAEKVPMVKRTAIPGLDYEVGVLVSPSHEALNLAPSMVQRAFDRTVEDFRQRGKDTRPKRPSGESLRRLRDPEEGLLLVYPIDPRASGVEGAEEQDVPIVGYAVVFPHSENAETTTYRVNEVMLDQLAAMMSDDEELDR